MYVKPQFDARFAEGVAYFKRMLRLLSGDSVAFEFVGCSGGGRIGRVFLIPALHILEKENRLRRRSMAKGVLA